MYIFCLDCECEVTLEVMPQIGDRIVCPLCESKMEVIGAEPLQLDWTYQKRPKYFYANSQPNWADLYRSVSKT